MTKRSHKKSIFTIAIVVLLVGASVAAQANSFAVSTESMNSSMTLIPLLSSIAFAVARKRG